MPSPHAYRRFAYILLILCFALGLLALRLHLLSGDVPLLALAALAGLVSVGLGVGMVLNNRISVFSNRG